MRINRLYVFLPKYKVQTLALILAFLNSPSWLLAQGFPQGAFSRGTSSGSRSGVPDTVQQSTDYVADTANISYFFADNLGQTFPEKDSLLDQSFQQYDPSRTQKYDFFNLGNPVSPAYSSVYQTVLRHGLDIGLHQYDVYKIRNRDIKFYQQTKTFSDLFYSGQQQENGLLKVRFARNFAKDVHFSLDYRRGYNLGLASQRPRVRALFYDQPLGRTVGLGMGLWVHRPRYDGFLTFTSNIVQQTDKGGLIDPNIFTDTEGGQFAEANAVLSDASSRHESYEYSYLQYFKLNRADSTGTKRNYLVSHQITWKNGTYSASDPFSGTPETSDSTFYKTLLNDTRGVRFYLRERSLENTFAISTTRSRFSKDSLRKIEGQNDYFEIGLTHAFHNLNQDLGANNYNNLILKGRWNFTPNDKLKVETYAHLNLLGFNAGDYRLNGELSFPLGKLGTLSAKASNQLYEPTFLQQNMVLTQRQFWQNDFKKTLETNLLGTLNFPKLGFEGTVAYTLLNNYVYYDSTFLPTQTSTPLSILQIIVNQNFKFRWLHLDNTVAFQSATESFFQLPLIYTKNSLYYEGKVFKKVMLMRTGFDVRWASTWYANGYMPLTGQFFVQNTMQAPPTPAVDWFLSAKVQSLRIFVKVENILGELTKNIYAPVLNYPTPDLSIVGATSVPFRFGLRWQLLN